MNVKLTHSSWARWDNYTSAGSSPLSDILVGVGHVQHAAQRDPSLVSMRSSAWQALLAHPDSRWLIERRGVSLKAFKEFLNVDALQIFDRESPAEYDVRIAHGEYVYEIAGVVDQTVMWRNP